MSTIFNAKSWLNSNLDLENQIQSVVIFKTCSTGEKHFYPPKADNNELDAVSSGKQNKLERHFSTCVVASGEAEN